MEVCLFDTRLDFNDLLHTLFLCDSNGVDTICVPASFLNYKNKFTTNSKVSCLIDFPLGLASHRVRCAAVIDAIHKGAQKIDIVANAFHMINYQKKDLKSNIKDITSICADKGVDARFVIEHKEFDYNQCIQMAILLAECGVQSIVSATGMYVDDVYDNIIMCHEIQSRTDMEVIPSSCSFDPSTLVDINLDQFPKFRVVSGRVKRFLGV